ncbi:MAG: bifunctional phosphopantothenoylcysteine decarboxylase/phosphopantothenate--cysteine ligase CoaBC [Staphylothermus sp.]|nr:bifunctional phosphopantothenoylcysteine decarboxylase/phosphopantothenate--cysteine ligase CoaBC [Staphylothermus sp.]
MPELPYRREYAPLIGKKILVGLTASSAIYRSIDLMRELIRMGAEVKAVMTKEALEYVSPKLVEWATGNKPLIELSGKAEHVALSNEYDALVIAPATLNTISRIAYGIVDQALHLLATAMMGKKKKIIVVPAMHINLFKSPQYQKAIKLLEELGVYIISPRIEENKAKYPPLTDLASCIETLINRERDLVGKKLLVTAGPTKEYIDPVRVITNPSSGYMGILIAREAACRGAEVDLVHGPIYLSPPYNVNTYNITTTLELAKKISELTSTKKYEAAIFAAAPADYTVMEKSPKKISTREASHLILRLRSTPKTIKYISKNNKPEKIIIFVAETTEDYRELVEKARQKLTEYGADIAIANNVKKPGIGFSSNYLEACIVTKDKYECLGVIRKEVIARKIVDLIT